MSNNRIGVGVLAAVAIALVAVTSNVLVWPALGGGQTAGVIPPTHAQTNVKHGNRYLLTAEEAALARAGGLLPADAKSVIAVSRRVERGEFVWDDKGVAKGSVVIWVDLRRQMISVFRGGHEIGASTIVYGTDSMETPVGRFRILARHRDYHSRAYDAPMPFSLFITNDGVALHGSAMSPRQATHGCIGLPVKFARLLFEATAKGDIVDVHRSDPVAVQRLARQTNT